MMDASTFPSAQLFTAANAPLEVFPTGSWANTPSEGNPYRSLGQFGMICTSRDANDITTQQQAICMAFLQINQSWLLKECNPDLINPTDLQLFTMQMQAEKFWALATN